MEVFQKDFASHFKDTFKLQILSWNIDSFSFTEKNDIQLQEQLIELTSKS